MARHIRSFGENEKYREFQRRSEELMLGIHSFSKLCNRCGGVSLREVTDLPGANLRSLQVLVEFREALPTLSETAINEVQEMVLSAQRSVQAAAQTLSECRADLWRAENTLRNTEEPGYEEYSNVKKARTEVAQAEAYFSEVQAAYIAFQSIANTLSSGLTGHFANAQRFLDERIEAAKLYQSLSVSDFVGTSVVNSPTQASRSVPAAPAKRLGENTSVARLPRHRTSTSALPDNSSAEANRSNIAKLTGTLGVEDDIVTSPLRGTSTSALPTLPNGMEWVEIDKINWGGVDGVPENLEFRKVSKENMKEMLEAFENKLLPALNENKDVSADELSAVDKENAAEDSSSSLRLCHDSMIGSSNISDVIVLHSKPLSTAGNDHPAANTPAFESGKKARLEGSDQNSNPDRNLAGREGAANIWDQGWQSEANDRELAFTSGRHRVLVARELGWKFIPARVLGEAQHDE